MLYCDYCDQVYELLGLRLDCSGCSFNPDTYNLFDDADDDGDNDMEVSL